MTHPSHPFTPLADLASPPINPPARQANEGQPTALRVGSPVRSGRRRDLSARAEQISRPPVTPSPKEVIDVVEATRLLGVCERTLRSYASAGMIPSFKIGSRRMFVRAVLLDWAAEQSKGGRS